MVVFNIDLQLHAAETEQPVAGNEEPLAGLGQGDGGVAGGVGFKNIGNVASVEIFSSHFV